MTAEQQEIELLARALLPKLVHTMKRDALAGTFNETQIDGAIREAFKIARRYFARRRELVGEAGT